MWQADHTPLDVMLLDEEGKPAKPYLTAIEDDYSRLIVGYRLSFQTATALTTALTLRQAIWSKDDPRWSACGIPTVFYSDHGSDFTSKHLEQVAADLPMELIFSQVSVPRDREKIERFFRSVDQLLLQDTPGYAPKGSTGVKAVLTLPAFEQPFGPGCSKTITPASTLKPSVSLPNEGKQEDSCHARPSRSNSWICCC